MTKTLFLDCEATIHEKGNPFSIANKLCCVGLLLDGFYYYLDIEHSGLPYNRSLEFLASVLDQTELIVNHNIKYDLNWIRRYLPGWKPKKVWDTQLFEYIFSHQTWVMPSLDDCLKLQGFEGKTDDLASRYWDKGVDTTEIPANELFEYNMGDVYGVEKLYHNQVAKQRPEQSTLFTLHCEDLLVLEEMEHNGMAFNRAACEAKAVETRKEYEAKKDDIIRLLELDRSYSDQYNLNSGDQLSAFLYGGSFPIRVREVVTKQYKKGPKEVERWGEKQLCFPRLVDPLEGTEVKKGGYFFVNEDVLRSLRPKQPKAKELISGILTLAGLEKMLSGYYEGLPKLLDRMQWPEGILHGTFNQCVARTGRSSCAQPNQQNFHGGMKDLFISRYV